MFFINNACLLISSVLNNKIKMFHAQCEVHIAILQETMHFKALFKVAVKTNEEKSIIIYILNQSMSQS